MTLQESLRALAESARAKRSADVQKVVDAALERLRHSGLAEACLQLGEMAPDFELPDVDGQMVSLESALRDGPAVVTFFRGGWCPYCNLALSAMELAAPALRALDARILAISPQRPAPLGKTHSKLNLGFSVLSDEGNRIARLFGLTFRMPDDLIAMYLRLGVNLAESNAAPEWELPIPATYVIGRDGTVAYAFIDVDYTRRAEPSDIIAAVQRIVADFPAPKALTS